jgi:hypothetical protein
VAAHEAHESHGDHERPEDWGWHHEFTLGRQIAGWLSIVALLLLMSSTHYNFAGNAATILTVLAIAGGLIIDLKRRRTLYRD